MDFDAAREPGQVVSPFEDAHNPAPGVRLGHGDDRVGDRLEVLLLEPEAPHRVVGVRPPEEAQASAD